MIWLIFSVTITTLTHRSVPTLNSPRTLCTNFSVKPIYSFSLLPRLYIQKKPWLFNSYFLYSINRLIRPNRGSHRSQTPPVSKSTLSRFCFTTYHTFLLFLFFFFYFSMYNRLQANISSSYPVTLTFDASVLAFCAKTLDDHGHSGFSFFFFCRSRLCQVVFAGIFR